MTTINLPKFIFINGPNGSGKTTLAKALCKQSAEIMLCSFADPMRNALLATFYCEELLSGSHIDLREESVKSSPLPFTRTRHGSQIVTHREWLNWFGEEMKRLFGDDIWGQLALQTVDLNDYYYKHFVFDGLRFAEDAKPFWVKFGEASLLTIHLVRNGKTFNSPSNIGGPCAFTKGKHLTLHNDGAISDLVPKLERALAS